MSYAKEIFLSEIPNLHSWDGGETWNSGGFDKFHLSNFIQMVDSFEDCRVIETGAGNSTISFLLSEPHALMSIAPDQELFVRIQNYCSDNSIDTTPLFPIIGNSEWCLPFLAKTTDKFHVALIDGAHGWPHVFIDLFYINHLLKVNGLLVIDDINLHSVKEVAKLLLSDEDNFELERDLGKALVFRKLKNHAFGEWNEQKYIVKMSDLYARTGNPFRIEAAAGFGTI